jgi:hypothetical protein
MNLIGKDVVYFYRGYRRGIIWFQLIIRKRKSNENR